MKSSARARVEGRVSNRDSSQAYDASTGTMLQLACPATYCKNYGWLLGQKRCQQCCIHHAAGSLACITDAASAWLSARLWKSTHAAPYATLAAAFAGHLRAADIEGLLIDNNTCATECHAVHNPDLRDVPCQNEPVCSVCTKRNQLLACYRQPTPPAWRPPGGAGRRRTLRVAPGCAPPLPWGWQARPAASRQRRTPRRWRRPSVRIRPVWLPAGATPR